MSSERFILLGHSIWRRRPARTWWPSSSAGPTWAENAAFRACFGREVAPARRVGRVCTAPVDDADLDQDRPWTLTDFVAGLNLADLEELEPVPALC